MGVKLFEILPRKEIELSELAGKKIAVDAQLMLYQFMSSIRQRDGTLLTDSKGQVTSHLQGLFSRSANLMQKGVKLCYVFEGKAPKLKEQVWLTRKKAKDTAREKFEAAKEAEDVAEMRKYAARTSVLTQAMVDEAKELIAALGLPIVQAPSEGEAQAAYMSAKGDVFACASQDADSIVFGAKRFIKNLTISEKRKMGKSLAYVSVKPEIYLLDDILRELNITREQLVYLAMLVGTDYNPGGVRGIGAKKALKLVKEKKPEELFIDWGFDYPWQEVYDTIAKIPITDDYRLEWNSVDRERVIKLLVGKHDFGSDRIEKTLGEIGKASRQPNLEKWF